MDIMVQFQDALQPNISEMDTTPILQSLSDEILPSFIPPPHPDLVHPNLLVPQEQTTAYLPPQTPSELPAGPFDTPMHLSLNDLPMPVFMNAPMDTLDPLSTSPFDIGISPDPFTMAVASTPSETLDLSPNARRLSVSPVQSQVPSPSILGASSSYGPLVPSSLDSALEPIPTLPARSRANTSVSPPSFLASTPPGMLNAAPEYPTAVSASSSSIALEESVSQQQPQTLIGRLLKDIAITAINAGDAFEHCKGPEQTTKVGVLRDQIAHVLDMLDAMSISDSNGFPGVTSHIPTATPTKVPTKLNPSTSMESSVDTNHLTISDQSRKRCASELEEHRSVKALKREPQEDAPIALSIQEAVISPAPVLSFTTPVVPYAVVQTTVPVVGNSRPPSRPPTPPSFVANNSFGTIKPQPSVTAAFPAFLPGAPAPGTLPLNTAVPPPAFPHSSWSDPIVPTRHHHSLSAGSISGPLPGLPASTSNVLPIASPFSANGIPGSLSQPLTNPSNSGASSINPVIGRMSRSGSISGTNFRNSYAPFPYTETIGEQLPSLWGSTKPQSSSIRGSHTNRILGDPGGPSKRHATFTTNVGHSSHNSPSDDEDDDDDSDSDASSSGKTVTYHTSGDRPPTSAVSDLPSDHHFEVDKVFFSFLNKLCSNLEATDTKGEQIHQTLMAKKMQRLDESPDFRPFKFRIQAFTNAFMDELAQNGWTQDKIPMKKARNYLWRQQYILRFNEDGKKAKSKGNHIWNIEARKTGEGNWEFRPFYRKIAGNPPNAAYCGVRWSWKPHIWHPQCSFKKIPVTYSSPSLPPWLSWKGGELSGTPPPDAENCQIMVIAKFPFENKEDQVTTTFSLNISPPPTIDSVTYPRSRRASLVNEPQQPPKRSTSDSALFQIPQRADSRMTRMDDTRVIRVLQNVAQRVTDEAESQFVSASPPKEGELQDLVKQKHVLEQTVHAYDKAISGKGHMDSRRLAVAAQHVVLQAAQTVIADRTVASGGVPVPQTETVAIQSVSVNELTNKTQDAIAMAVKINGTASNEVDIIVTATSILKSQTPLMENPPVVLPPAPRIPSSSAVPSRITSSFPPSTLSPLPEYT